MGGYAAIALSGPTLPPITPTPPRLNLPTRIAAPSHRPNPIGTYPMSNRNATDVIGEIFLGLVILIIIIAILSLALAGYSALQP